MFKPVFDFLFVIIELYQKTLYRERHAWKIKQLLNCALEYIKPIKHD